MVPIPPFGNAEDRVYDTPLAAVFCCDERPDEGDRSKLVFFLLPLPFVDILTMSDYYATVAITSLYLGWYFLMPLTTVFS